MLLSLLFLSKYAAAANPDDYKYELKHVFNPDCDEYDDKSGTITITDWKGNGNLYLRECKNLEKVIYKNGNIPAYAFYASSLSSIQIDKDTKTIGAGAFAYCERLTRVTFDDPDGFSSISEGAFYHSGLTNIDPRFPDITTIASYTFAGCPLTDYQIDFTNKKLEEVQSFAFYESNLSSIIFSDSMTSIGQSAFENCQKLAIGGQAPIIKANVIYSNAFRNCPLVSEIIVSSTSIGKSAFHCDPEKPTDINEIRQMTTGTAPDLTTLSLTIGPYAFCGRNVKLLGLQPFSDLTIEEFAFAKCTFSKTGNKKGYGIQIDNDVDSNNRPIPIVIGQHAFYTADFGTETFNLVIGESKATTGSVIGYHAFESSKGLIKLTFVEENGGPIGIEDYAFYRSGVTNSDPEDESQFLRFPTRVSKIGEKSFAECQSIAGAVYIKDKSIGAYAFYNCTNIKKIIIHNCETIEKGAFEICFNSNFGIENLTITCDRDINSQVDSITTEIQERAFYGSGLQCKLVLHSFISSIGEYAFAYNTKLGNEEIIINADSISPYAFSNCGVLSQPITIHSGNVPFHCFDENEIYDITIGGKIDGSDSCEIETEAFYDIIFRGFVKIEGTAGISYNAFQLCSFAKDITINGTIGDYAFDNCSCSTRDVTLSIGAVGTNDNGYNRGVGKYAFLRFGKINQFHLKFTEFSQNEYHIGRYAFFEANITGDVEIPWYFSEIEDYAFTNCTTISSVSIDNSNIRQEAFAGCVALRTLQLRSHKTENDGGISGMKTIGVRAFYSLGITSDLIIPSTVTEISAEAFANCGNIRKLVIESGSKLQKIGKQAFENCRAMVSEINVTETLLSIEARAFSNCAALRKITFNENAKLQKIGDYAFANCSSLNGVLDFPKTCKYIGQYAFHNCNSFNHHLTIKTICDIGDCAFYGCTKIKRAELDFDTDGNTDYCRIGDYAFTGIPCYNNHNVDSTKYGDEEEDDILDIPFYIYCIGQSAFERCTGLKRVRFHIGYNYQNEGFSRTEIGIFNRSFYGSSVSSVSFMYYNNYRYYYPVRYNAFSNCQNLIKGIYIEGGTFEGYTFESCNNLIGGITISGGSFGDCTFANCQRLSGAEIIMISDGQFGQSTFANCANLRGGVAISGGTFGDYTFANCSSLRGGLSIGGDMSNYAFINCVSLGPDINNVTLYLSGSLGRHCFDGCTSFGGILDLIGSASIGESAFEDFNMPFTLRAMYSSSASVGRRAFYHCSLVGDLDISGIEEIGNEAFANCPNQLRSLTLYPSTSCGINVFANTVFANESSGGIVMLTAYLGSKFNQYTFRDVKGLNRLTLFGSGDVAYKSFYGMSSLEGELNIPSGANTIEGYAFSGCGFHNIKFGTSVTLKEGAFENCKRLNGTINLENILEFPKRIFYGCSNLQSITFDYGFSTALPVFERSAFEDCSSLNFYFEMPQTKPPRPPPPPSSSTYTFNKYVFSGCSKLDGINGLLYIPKYVDKVDDYAFRDCAFTRLEFEERDSGKSLIIGTGAFQGCSKLTYDLILPEIQDIYQNDKIPDRAFSGCSGLQSIEYKDSIDTIGKYAFNGCSGVHGPLEIKPSVKRIEEYAFAGCTGFSGHLTINVDPSKGQTIIGSHAFDGCSGFKKGSLTFFIESDEEAQKVYPNNIQNQNQFPYFRYKYFLRIGAKAFDDTKFSNIYYNGRFQPDCDYDIGFSHTKGIHTSSNYLNKTFCNYPLHNSKLSGGAIAGITIAVIVVVAIIVILIIYFILRGKKNKDKSEDEVEMNADP